MEIEKEKKKNKIKQRERNNIKKIDNGYKEELVLGERVLLFMGLIKLYLYMNWLMLNFRNCYMLF